MTADSLTCPFCNAVVPPSPGLVVGQKTSCPRCGEAFTVTHLPVDHGFNPSPIPTPPTSYRKPIRRNRLVGGAVLAVMLLMAGLGLAYALSTVQMRRDHDRALPRQHRKPWLLRDPSGDTEPNLSPAELAGLGYLPSTTGVVVALQVEDLLASPAGKSLRLRSWKVRDREVSLATIREWTGLAIEDIEHIVVGVDIRDSDVSDFLPPVHIVIRTRRSDGANRIRVALKATSRKEAKTPEGGKRTLYKALIGNLTVQLWPADQRTVVMGLFSDLDRVPSKPAAGIAHLPSEVREAIEKRLPPGTPFWAVGHCDNWKNTWLPTLLGQAKELPLAGRLEEVKTFALALVPTQPVKIAGAFRIASEAGAAKIVKEDLQPRQLANPKAFKFSHAGPWIDVQQAFEGEREK